MGRIPMFFLPETRDLCPSERWIVAAPKRFYTQHSGTMPESDTGHREDNVILQTRVTRGVKLSEIVKEILHETSWYVCPTMNAIV